jgi:hypothetical protein
MAFLAAFVKGKGGGEEEQGEKGQCNDPSFHGQLVGGVVCWLADCSPT